MRLKYEPASEPQVYLLGGIEDDTPIAQVPSALQGYLTYKKTHPPRTLP